jgi:hypothetical protein
MKAVEVRFKAKDIWRSLTAENVINITYPGFLHWLKLLKIDYRFGIVYEDLQRIRHYAVIRSRSERKTVHRIDSKGKTISELRKLGDVARFGDAIRIAETTGLCSASTLYRRASKQGWKPSAKHFYKVDDLLNFLLGAIPGL